MSSSAKQVLVFPGPGSFPAHVRGRKRSTQINTNLFQIQREKRSQNREAERMENLFTPGNLCKDLWLWGLVEDEYAEMGVKEALISQTAEKDQV